MEIAALHMMTLNMILMRLEMIKTLGLTSQRPTGLCLVNDEHQKRIF